MIMAKTESKNPAAQKKVTKKVTKKVAKKVAKQRPIKIKRRRIAQIARRR